MYEHRCEPVLPVKHFLKRVMFHGAVAATVLVASLFGGMLGYVHFEHLSLLDAFLNAAMLLGGMGPVHTPITPGGKLFAGLYALYSGVVFLIVVGIVLAPVVHRALQQVSLGRRRQGRRRRCSRQPNDAMKLLGTLSTRAVANVRGGSRSAGGGFRSWDSGETVPIAGERVTPCAAHALETRSQSEVAQVPGM